MNELRERFKETIAASEHTVRNTEHSTFFRLLYRSKNQHRHGLYFRRLQHTQRLLRRVNGHVVWKSLRSALGTSANNAPQTAAKKKKKSIPLLLSTVTRDDVNNAIQLFDTLVSSVIPDAATAMTTQLVVRKHFLPYAVSIIASLSRIFVIERKLLSDLRVISVDLNVFLSETVDGVSLLDDHALPGDEDIGLEVSPSNNGGQVEELSDGATHQMEQPSVTDIETTMRSHEAKETDSGKQTKSLDIFKRNDEEPSLYSVVAQKNGPSPSLSKTENAISVTLLPLPPLACSSTTARVDPKRKRSKDLFAHPPRPLKRLKANTESMEDNDATSDGQPTETITPKTDHDRAPGSSGSSKAHSLAEKETRDPKRDIGSDPDSNSEDCDDIFESGGQAHSSSKSSSEGIETSGSESEKLDGKFASEFSAKIPSDTQTVNTDDAEDSGSEDLDDIFGALGN